MRQYEWTPLVDIQGWSEVPRSLPLFESILVYENAPIDRVLRDWQGSLEVENATIFSNSSSFYKTNYPIAIAVYPGSNFCIGIDYDFRRFDTATIIGILQHFEILLQDIVTHPEANLKDLSLLTSKQQHLASKLEKEVAFNFV